MFGKKKKKKASKYPNPQLGDKGGLLPTEVSKWIYGIVLFLFTVIIGFSYFEKSGIAGRILMSVLVFLFGNAVFGIPFILALTGIALFSASLKRSLAAANISMALVIFGITGVLGVFGLDSEEKSGGWIGFFLAKPLVMLFEFWVSQIIFSAVIFIGLIILVHMGFSSFGKKEEEKSKEEISEPKEETLVARIFKKVAGTPKFKVKEIEHAAEDIPSGVVFPEAQESPVKRQNSTESVFQFPPLDLLENDKENPTSGDIKVNSSIIKKTLQNFDILVEMSEVNIGPTVTQYTLKPSEGVKLSKITALSNDLALSLAAHPIRIEAPIPGRSLVGVEIPNKVRARVRMRNLAEAQEFQDSKTSKLKIILGRDVSGKHTFADLAKMPHMLVAGSTGTGKTIFLNSLITGFLYQNTPETLRFILIDPKRVEFSIYESLPHLLCPIIFDPHQTINALKWAVSEMERRFSVLAELKTRNISSYNESVLKKGGETLPFIVIIIDELADLMMAKGREMETGIVRLAQMARAVGIHLVVATQRPSVEVITGLIKANITSRVTFQTASQVDSRTVIDTSGAEKLLGAGDMLFVSAELGKPKRIQGAYISEKEVKDVTSFIKDHAPAPGYLDKMADEISQSLERQLNTMESDLGGGDPGEKDPIYEEAKKMVIESGRASASLLQRRFRLGYARAARLIDLMEEDGVVGPAEGAKPREVYMKSQTPFDGERNQGDDGFRPI